VPTVLAKIASDLGFPRRISGRLLHDNPFCSGVDPDLQHGGPKAFAGSVAVNSGSHGGSLAWWASDNNIGGFCVKGSDIVINWYSVEPAGKNIAPKFIYLAKCHHFYPGLIEAKSVASDARE
jgi:hypothetical protein